MSLHLEPSGTLSFVEFEFNNSTIVIEFSRYKLLVQILVI